MHACPCTWTSHKTFDQRAAFHHLACFPTITGIRYYHSLLVRLLLPLLLLCSILHLLLLVLLLFSLLLLVPRSFFSAFHLYLNHLDPHYSIQLSLQLYLYAHALTPSLPVYSYTEFKPNQGAGPLRRGALTPKVTHTGVRLLVPQLRLAPCLDVASALMFVASALFFLLSVPMPMLLLYFLLLSSNAVVFPYCPTAARYAMLASKLPMGKDNR